LSKVLRVRIEQGSVRGIDYILPPTKNTVSADLGATACDTYVNQKRVDIRGVFLKPAVRFEAITIFAENFGVPMEDPCVDAENDLKFLSVFFDKFWYRYIAANWGAVWVVSYSFGEISAPYSHPAWWYDSRKTANNRRVVSVCLFQLSK
jgi:hypothetical protein